MNDIVSNGNISNGNASNGPTVRRPGAGLDTAAGFNAPLRLAGVVSIGVGSALLMAAIALAVTIWFLGLGVVCGVVGVVLVRLGYVAVRRPSRGTAIALTVVGLVPLVGAIAAVRVNAVVEPLAQWTGAVAIAGAALFVTLAGTGILLARRRSRAATATIHAAAVIVGAALVIGLPWATFQGRPPFSGLRHDAAGIVNGCGVLELAPVPTKYGPTRVLTVPAWAIPQSSPAGPGWRVEGTVETSVEHLYDNEYLERTTRFVDRDGNEWTPTYRGSC